MTRAMLSIKNGYNAANKIITNLTAQFKEVLRTIIAIKTIATKQ
jgi:hypothetical protein